MIRNDEGRRHAPQARRQPDQRRGYQLPATGPPALLVYVELGQPPRVAIVADSELDERRMRRWLASERDRRTMLGCIVAILARLRHAA